MIHRQHVQLRHSYIHRHPRSSWDGTHRQTHLSLECRTGQQAPSRKDQVNWKKSRQRGKCTSNGIRPGRYYTNSLSLSFTFYLSSRTFTYLGTLPSFTHHNHLFAASNAILTNIHIHSSHLIPPISSLPYRLSSSLKRSKSSTPSLYIKSSHKGRTSRSLDFAYPQSLLNYSFQYNRSQDGSQSRR